MRIAQVAPLFESVPPTRYGGTERVVHWLTEELVALGHDVTLFASAESRTAAHLVPCCDEALRLAGVEDEISPHVVAIERALDPGRGFDVIHFHTGTLHFNAARRTATPTLTTMHGRLDDPGTRAAAWEFRDLPLVSISNEQREPMPWANWLGTVHHGMPAGRLAFSPSGGASLVFLGRMSPEKRPDRAIRLARAAGAPRVMAAEVDRRDRAWFEEVIAPLLAVGDDVTFVGEVDERGKQELLAGALGLLFPIDWPEPFGLVMIEALACGTPVVAWRHGSVPSIVTHGASGFIVDDEAAAVDAVQRLHTLDRAAVRAAFEARFTARRMALDYLALYEALAASAQPSEEQEVIDGRHT